MPLLFAGCVELINFDIDRTGNRLVVDGMITNSPGPYTLKLRRTTEEEKISDPLSGAKITITDNLGNSEQYFETTDGVYKLGGYSVRGVPGRSYTIEIELSNGQTYRSEPEQMPTALARDSIHYEFDTITTVNSYGSSSETEVIRVIRDTSVPKTEDPLFLKWEVQETYKFSEFDFPDPFHMPPPSCYVTEYPDPQAIHLYDGSELASGQLAPIPIVEREIDYTFYQRHFINVIQYSMTRKGHEYWNQVDQVVNRSGTIFDVPPANANSNISNIENPDEIVLGYFHAAASDTTRFYLLPADLPIHISNPCSRFSTPDCQGGCSTFDNSRKDPPYYWLQD
jgi:hypothetical protein